MTIAAPTTTSEDAHSKKCIISYFLHMLYGENYVRFKKYNNRNVLITTTSKSREIRQLAGDLLLFFLTPLQGTPANNIIPPTTTTSTKSY